MSMSLEFWLGEGCGVCVGGGSGCVESGEVAMQAGKGAHHGLRCGTAAAFLGVTGVEQVEFVGGVAAGGVKTRVPGAGVVRARMGADRLAFGVPADGRAMASIK